MSSTHGVGGARERGLQAALSSRVLRAGRGPEARISLPRWEGIPRTAPAWSCWSSFGRWVTRCGTAKAQRGCRAWGPQRDTEEDTCHLTLVTVLYPELLELCSFKRLSRILTMTHNKNLRLLTL